jgi:hypothetical protein
MELIPLNENGHAISPILPENVKNYLIDIDGTICDDIPNEEPERMLTAAVYPDALETLNKWYDEGHIITFFTSRTDEHELVTKQWLEKWNFKYHNIIFNKPRGGNYFFIDNHIVKAARFTGKWNKMITKQHEIVVFPD